MLSTNGLERLTDREKEVLRRWFERKTAKEIALELDISHHAVEKRLKMDVGSSHEAARMLAAHEGYDRAVAGHPDLEETRQSPHKLRSKALAIGAIAMIAAAYLALVLIPQGSVVEPSSPRANPPNAAMAKVAQQTRRVFDSLDADGSGFLERPETPLRRMILLGPDDRLDTDRRIVRTARLDPPGQPDEALLDEFYLAADQDGDGVVSYTEYHAWSVPRLAEMGLDLAGAAAPKD